MKINKKLQEKVWNEATSFMYDEVLRVLKADFGAISDSKLNKVARHITDAIWLQVRCVSQYQIAQLTGLARQTIANMKRNNELPYPCFVIEGKPFWSMASIIKWAAENDRKIEDPETAFSKKPNLLSDKTKDLILEFAMAFLVANSRDPDLKIEYEKHMPKNSFLNVGTQAKQGKVSTDNNQS
jgi:predicted DNA-binding transcriptional regulator AlpA